MGGGSLMADYRVLDVETVVDPTVWTPPDPKWKLARSEYACGVAVVRDEPFPPPQACRVVAMSWCDLSSVDGRYYHFDGLTSLCDWRTSSLVEADAAEKKLIAAFSEAEEGDLAQLVTWNGRGFDLPVVNLRALKHKISMGWYYQEDGMRYRYSDGGHCDLMDYLGDHGAGRNMKLHDVCRLVGLPGKTGDVSGGSVAAVVAAGDDETAMMGVGSYCMRDALQTALVFVRSRFHKGMISAVEHDAALASFEVNEAVTHYLDDVDWKSLRVST